MKTIKIFNPNFKKVTLDTTGIERPVAFYNRESDSIIIESYNKNKKYQFFIFVDKDTTILPLLSQRAKELFNKRETTLFINGYMGCCEVTKIFVSVHNQLNTPVGLCIFNVESFEDLCKVQNKYNIKLIKFENNKYQFSSEDHYLLSNLKDGQESYFINFDYED